MSPFQPSASAAPGSDIFNGFSEQREIAEHGRDEPAVPLGFSGNPHGIDLRACKTRRLLV